MKHRNLKKLTREQKIILSKHDGRYKSSKWLCKSDTPDVLILKKRTANEYLVIDKAALA